MKKVLLRSQKNELFKLIIDKGYDPSNFSWSEEKSSYIIYIKVSKIVHVDTDLFFRFDFFENQWRCVFSPGRFDWEGEERVLSWQDAKTVFIKWLEILKHEVLEPDLWSDISKYQLAVGAEIEVNISNEPFTSYQVDQIIESLNQAKAFLTERNLIDKEHNQFIEDKFNYLVEAARRQGRKDWLHTCIGAIITIAVALALNPGQTNTIWNIIKGAVAGFLKLLQ